MKVCALRPALGLVNFADMRAYFEPFSQQVYAIVGSSLLASRRRNLLHYMCACLCEITKPYQGRGSGARGVANIGVDTRYFANTLD